MTADPRCGTTAGRQAHRKAQQPTCAACRAAEAADRRRRAAYAYLTGGQKMLVDATGTRRRVQALVRIGWSLKELADRLGTRFQNVHDLTVRAKVRRATAAKVAALYDELSMIPGPSVKSKQYAIRRGWPPPLSWDDDPGPGGIDDPAARPMHNARGTTIGQPRDLDREEQVMRLTRAGLSAKEIALRLRMHQRQVVRIRTRYRKEGAA